MHATSHIPTMSSSSSSSTKTTSYYSSSVGNTSIFVERSCISGSQNNKSDGDGYRRCAASAAAATSADVATDDVDASTVAIVIVLGWMGCHVKHLKKYTELYHHESNSGGSSSSSSGNVVTIGVVPDTLMLMFGQEYKYKQLAKDIILKTVEIVEEFEKGHDDDGVEGSSSSSSSSTISKTKKKKNKVPIHFHILSNGGYSVLMYIEQVIQEELINYEVAKKEGGGDNDIRGDTNPYKVFYDRHHNLNGWQIIDSAPCYNINWKMTYGAFKDAMPKHLILLVWIGMIFVLVMAIYETMKSKLVGSTKTTVERFWNYAKNNSLGKRQYYIYSSNNDKFMDISKFQELLVYRNIRLQKQIKKRQIKKNRRSWKRTMNKYDNDNDDAYVIKSMNFKDSKHVEHMLKYKTKYQQILNETILAGRNGHAAAAAKTSTTNKSTTRNSNNSYDHHHRLDHDDDEDVQHETSRTLLLLPTSSNDINRMTAAASSSSGPKLPLLSNMFAGCFANAADSNSNNYNNKCCPTTGTSSNYCCLFPCW